MNRLPSVVWMEMAPLDEGRSAVELILLVEDAPEDGDATRVLGESIFPQPDTVDEPRRAYPRGRPLPLGVDGDQPRVIQWHGERGGVLPA